MKKSWLAYSCLLTIPLMGYIYTLLNVHCNQTYHLSTYLDQSIPFIKAFIIPYMLWMPFLYLTLIYIGMKDRNLYYRTLITYNLSVYVQLLIIYSHSKKPNKNKTKSDSYWSWGFHDHFINHVCKAARYDRCDRRYTTCRGNIYWSRLSAKGSNIY
jgi:hypothetical protein